MIPEKEVELIIITRPQNGRAMDANLLKIKSNYFRKEGFEVKISDYPYDQLKKNSVELDFKKMNYIVKNTIVIPYEELVIPYEK